jgi:hypothetical protein
VALAAVFGVLQGEIGRESRVERRFSKMGGGMRLPKVTSRVNEEVRRGEQREGSSAYSCMEHAGGDFPMQTIYLLPMYG